MYIESDQCDSLFNDRVIGDFIFQFQAIRLELNTSHRKARKIKSPINIY